MKRKNTDSRTGEEQQGVGKCGRMGVWKSGTRPYLHTSTLPHLHTLSRSLRMGAACASLLAAVATVAQEKPASDGVLARLSQFVGGEWVSSAKLPSGQPVARFVHTMEYDGKVLRSRGRVGSTPVESVIGWDPAAGKTYYLDRHGAETVYFGHGRLEGEELLFEFRSLTGKPSGWKSREKFLGKDSFQTVMTPAGGQEGKDSQKVTLQRVPHSEPSAEPAPTKAENPQSELTRLALVIGGVWHSEAKDPSGKPFVELRYAWGPGRKTILGTGTMAGTRVESVIGWDSEAGKPFYLDLHGPHTLYFGHYTLHDEDITVDFRTLVGPRGEFRTNAWFPDSNTYMAVVRPLKNGQVGEGHKVKLVRQKDEG